MAGSKEPYNFHSKNENTWQFEIYHAQQENISLKLVANLALKVVLHLLERSQKPEKAARSEVAAS